MLKLLQSADASDRAGGLDAVGVSLAAICSLCLCVYVHVHVSISTISMRSLRRHEEDGVLLVSELEGVLVVVARE